MGSQEKPNPVLSLPLSSTPANSHCSCRLLLLLIVCCCLAAFLPSAHVPSLVPHSRFGLILFSLPLIVALSLVPQCFSPFPALLSRPATPAPVVRLAPFPALSRLTGPEVGGSFSLAWHSGPAVNLTANFTRLTSFFYCVRTSHPVSLEIYWLLIFFFFFYLMHPSNLHKPPCFKQRVYVYAGACNVICS